MSGQVCGENIRPAARGTWSRQEDNVQPRQALGQRAKSFACAALYTIASRCKANVLFCHCEPQAVMTVLVGAGQEKEFLLSTAPARILEHHAVITRATKPLVFSETVGHRLRHEARAGDASSIPAAQAERRLRPLARRRLRTARPFLVAIRARKPWLRLRFNTLG